MLLFRVAEKKQNKIVLIQKKKTYMNNLLKKVKYMYTYKILMVPNLEKNAKINIKQEIRGSQVMPEKCCLHLTLYNTHDNDNSYMTAISSYTFQVRQNKWFFIPWFNSIQNISYPPQACRFYRSTQGSQ